VELSKRCKRTIALSILTAVMITTAAFNAGAPIHAQTPNTIIHAQTPNTIIHAQTPNTIIHAQTPNLYSKGLAVYLTLFGINSTTGDVFAFVKAHGLLKNILFNATKLDMSDNKTDGIALTSLSFPNLTLNAGEPYSTCVVILKDAKMICVTDYKTPSARPQFVDISVQ
jgi:hypothetical protein